jgi:hypothetical protein
MRGVAASAAADAELLLRQAHERETALRSSAARNQRNSDEARVRGEVGSECSCDVQYGSLHSAHANFTINTQLRSVLQNDRQMLLTQIAALNRRLATAGAYPRLVHVYFFFCCLGVRVCVCVC